MTGGRVFAVAAAGVAAVAAVSCAAAPSLAPSPDGGSAIVVGRSASTPPGCVRAGGDRDCAAVTTYRLAIKDPAGAVHGVRVDAAVYRVCGVGEGFPACAQGAS